MIIITALFQPRLRCLVHIFSHLDSEHNAFLTAVVPEVSLLFVMYNPESYAHIKTAKKNLASHQLPRLIFTTKKSHSPRQILSLGKHVKCMHFSDDIVFSLALIIFLLFF